VRRVVALGASNLTRGLPALVGLARRRYGPEAEIVAALGLGRSFGARSRILARSLPGILECGLWDELRRQGSAPTRALVMDVGNDILYGFAPDRILAWVGESLRRLEELGAEIVLAGLPLPSIERLSPRKFLVMRSILFPPCRLSHAEVLGAARRVDEGLRDLARTRGLQWFELRPEWYGLDPIHIRPSAWRAAFGQLLAAGEGSLPDDRTPLVAVPEALRLYAMRPERESFFGWERIARQDGLVLPGGGRVWLY
jgi:hypothetical protein